MLLIIIYFFSSCPVLFITSADNIITIPSNTKQRPCFSGCTSFLRMKKLRMNKLIRSKTMIRIIKSNTGKNSLAHLLPGIPKTYSRITNVIEIRNAFINVHLTPNDK